MRKKKSRNGAGMNVRPDIRKDRNLGYLTIRRGLVTKFKAWGIRCTRRVDTVRRSNSELWVSGIESGGATDQGGHYVTFCTTAGERLVGYSHNKGLNRNAWHTSIAAPELIRLEMAREVNMYQLLITQHWPDPSQVDSERPGSLIETIFYCERGTLNVDLIRFKSLRGYVMPTFVTPAGDALEVPWQYWQAVYDLTAATNCVQCNHSHYVSLSEKTSEEGSEEKEEN